MKKSHILAIVIIAIMIGIIVSTAGDSSSYVCFKEAIEMSAEGNSDKVHVVGKVKRDSKGNLSGLYYRPEIDPNYFSFILVDNNMQEQTVVYNNPKPQDFERSEQIVIIGSMKNEIFQADKILMKCPSKYEETELKASI
ncbi:MAG: cytochrome c maturation protein CcmE [Cytophagaceae bacterium]